MGSAFELAFSPTQGHKKTAFAGGFLKERIPSGSNQGIFITTPKRGSLENWGRQVPWPENAAPKQVF
jgi:hypothetical protein